MLAGQEESENPNNPAALDKGAMGRQSNAQRQLWKRMEKKEVCKSHCNTGVRIISHKRGLIIVLLPALSLSVLQNKWKAKLHSLYFYFSDP